MTGTDDTDGRSTPTTGTTDTEASTDAAEADAGDGAGPGASAPATDGGSATADAPEVAEASEATPADLAVARPTDPLTLAGVFCKGLFMGAADTVPGMSGGTVALVTGIYERLIAAITGFDPRDLRHVLRVHRPEGRAGLRQTLADVDAPFLLALGAGVLTAVATVAGVVEVVAEQSPGPLNAFFFGLIAASAVVLFGEVDLDARRVVVGLVAALVAFAVTGVTGDGGVASESLLVLYLAATLAASAMVLPGVSGAFLLLVLGQYDRFLGLVTDVTGALPAAVGGTVTPLVDPLVGVAVFGAGAVTGVLSVGHVVGWALANYRGLTLAALVGLLVGGLRLPAAAAAAVTAPTPAALAPVLGAAALGAAVLLGFDYLTDDLDY
jgi:putative membrane protein